MKLESLSTSSTCSVETKSLAPLKATVPIKQLTSHISPHNKDGVVLKPAMLLHNKRLVKVASIPAKTPSSPTAKGAFMPKPPTIAKSTRPSSSARLRNIVMQCRQDTS